MNTSLVVYDTMVFLQAAIHPDRRYATFAAVEDGRFILGISPELLTEVRDVLVRPALAMKFPALTPDRVAQFLENVYARAMTFSNVASLFTWPQHPDDDHVINLAIHAKARYLVTWETRLLKLGTDTSPAANLLRQLAPDLAIITPQAFADLLKAQATDPSV